jgi:hypothetical protein
VSRADGERLGGLGDGYARLVCCVRIVAGANCVMSLSMSILEQTDIWIPWDAAITMDFTHSDQKHLAIFLARLATGIHATKKVGVTSTATTPVVGDVFEVDTMRLPRPRTARWWVVRLRRGVDAQFSSFINPHSRRSPASRITL